MTAPTLGKHHPVRAALGLALRIALVAILGVLALELGWRGYLAWIGEGFFAAPDDFRSPFFTGYEPPFPAASGDTLWYRNGELAIPKPADEIRVLCFGGSTTVNARAGFSYPELLEARFAPDVDGYRVRVMNAASDGYATPHTLVNLALRNLQAAPDVITVYHNINDSSALCFGDAVTSDYANKYLTDVYLDLRHRAGLVAAITRVSRLARYLVFRWQADQYAAHKDVSDEELARGLEHFRRNLRSIVAVARAHGIRVVLASQAGQTTLRTEPVFAAYNRAVAEVAVETGSTFVDVAGHVTDDAAFLPDLIHNTATGVEEVAAALYEPLRDVVTEVVRARHRPEGGGAGHRDAPRGTAASAAPVPKP